MSRKEFLKLMGIGALVLANLDALFKLLTGHSATSGHGSSGVAYGSQGYGGYTGKHPNKGKGGGVFS